MNYLLAITAFNKLAEIERISPKEQALWNALMSIANSLNWPETFTVANLTLQSKAVLTERDVRETRNRLIQRGLISYKPRGGNKAPGYSMTDLTDNIEVKTVGKNVVKSVGTDVVTDVGTDVDNPPALNKLNKTKQNNKPPTSPKGDDVRFESFWTAYPKKKSKLAARKAFAKHKPDDALLDLMLEAIEKQSKTEQWTRDNGQYIPHPSTWLNGKRWEDEETLVLPKTDYEEDVKWA